MAGITRTPRCFEYTKTNESGVRGSIILHWPSNRSRSFSEKPFPGSTFLDCAKALCNGKANQRDIYNTHNISAVTLFFSGFASARAQRLRRDFNAFDLSTAQAVRDRS